MKMTGRPRDQSDLDPFEVKILRLIQGDADLSVAELAEKVGLSSTPCWRRLDRLEREGFVRRKVALLDPVKLGLNVQIFALIKLDAVGRGRLDEFAQAINAYDQVMECYAMMGNFDYLVRVVAADIPSYHDFVLKVLSQLPGVMDISSFVAMSELKSTTALPV